MESKNTPIYEALNKLLTCYLRERNIEKILSMATDDIYSIGTSIKEEAFSKKEFEKLLIEDIGGMPTAMDYTILSYHEKKRSSDIYDCFCNMSIIISISKTEKLHFDTRFLASFTNINGEFLINTMHMSQASVNQEEHEFYPLHFESTAIEKLDKSSQKELLELLMKSMPGGVLGVYEDKKFPIYVINDTLLQMLGYTYNEFISSSKGLFSKVVHPDDLHILISILECGFDEKHQYEVDYRLLKSDGSFIWVHDVGRQFVTEDGRLAIISVIVDVSENILTKEHLKEETMRDPLTNLYNRKAGEKLILEKLKQNLGFAFMIMDIDNFKQVNDIYGHHMGDTILIYLANQLTNSFHYEDIIVRLGGDEFIIYISSDSNMDIVRKKLNSISRNYIKKIQEFCPNSNSTLSVGGIFGKDVQPFTDVYQKADKVLYDIKHNDKGHTKIIAMS